MTVLAYAAKREGANAKYMQDPLPLKTEHTAFTREKGRGAIWESTGSYISLVLLGRR